MSPASAAVKAKPAHGLVVHAKSGGRVLTANGFPKFISPPTLPASTVPVTLNPTTTISPCKHKCKGATTTTQAPRPPAAVATTPPTVATAATTVPPEAFVAPVATPPTVTPGPSPGAASPVPTKRAKATPKPGASGEFTEPMVLANGGWQGLSLHAATNLKVPILFGLAVALFVLIQALIDRRDPKLSRAPERGDDDTVGFN
jgi:hypothetical protein